MTLNKFKKIIDKLIEQGHGRTQVSVNKESFSDNRESDGCVILNVYGAEYQYVPQAAGDGGTQFNADGTERYKRTIVIFGNNHVSTE